MSNITAIQSSDSLNSLYPSRARAAAPESYSFVNRDLGPDTVAFSEEALALLGKAKGGEEEENSGAALPGSFETTDNASSGTVSLKNLGKSMFAIMLESLFMADLEESADASARAAEDGMPRKTANPMEDSGKAAGIKKLMNDVASGKADISDLPKAMGAKGGGGQGARAESAAAKDTAETVEA